MLAALLEAGATVDSATDVGETPLFAAAQWGHEAVVSTLLLAGAQADRARDDGCTLILIATQEGHAAVMTVLSGAVVQHAA